MIILQYYENRTNTPRNLINTNLIRLLPTHSQCLAEDKCQLVFNDKSFRKSSRCSYKPRMKLSKSLKTFDRDY